MTQAALPALWLILFLVGLPQFSETVYSPSLPDIAHTLQTSESIVEYTLTIYLFGISIGTLFWGRLSDKLGRKTCVLCGLCLFILGCIGCYASTSITMLMISRLIQAFGGSVGSVLGQAICRDAFHGPTLSKVYVSIGSALSLFPAIGPIIGGVIAQNFRWSSIFLFLIIFAIGLTILVAKHLPETHHARKSNSLFEVAMTLLKDKKVISLGIIVGGCNGIFFSYFAEGSFCLQFLGLSPSQYGLSFLITAAGTMMGGVMSKYLHKRHTSETILKYGLMIIFIASGIWTLLSLYEFSPLFMIGIIMGAQMIVMMGICMATSNALAMALADYKPYIGTASSLFGFFYYVLVSLFTFGMGFLHNGTLLPMPLYFASIGLLMMLIQRFRVNARAS